MKLHKIFAIAIAALAFTSCSDDDDFNTASAVVEMGETSILAQEDFAADEYYKVPILVEGNTNGPIQVTVEVTGNGTSPATEDLHYIITQKTVVIPAGVKTGYIEFHTTGDWSVNEDREFICTIVGAQGATIGQNRSTVVTLLDDEHLFIPIYEKMDGLWTATDDSGASYDLIVTTYPEGDENYLRKVTISGWNGVPFFELDMTCRLNTITNEVTLSAPVGSSFGAANFGGDLGVCNVFLTGVNIREDGSLGLSLDGTVNATSNQAHNAFVFRNPVCGGVFSGNFSGANFQGSFFLYTAFSMVQQ